MITHVEHPPELSSPDRGEPETALLPEAPSMPLVTRREAQLHGRVGGAAATIPVRTAAVIGSSPQADISIDDPTVSRVHCRLVPRDDGIWLTDLGSRNGTFVDTIRVKEVRIPDGATLRLGETELVLRYARTAQPVDLWPTDQLGELVGRSVAMRELFALVHRIAKHPTSVLIQGETGTGKELVAQAIHRLSPRAEAPFVVVDCAAIPHDLIEAELFGYERGAFTGASRTRVGAIESAHGGTVLLDEVGELPLEVQPRLLRALESRTIKRLGRSTYRTVDVRFIAATHRDLLEMVSTGAFREDLYFRLAVLPLAIPPLRARAEDIPLLVGAMTPPGFVVPDEVMAELCRRPWYGNVRELRNAVERIVALGPEKALWSSLAPAAIFEQGLPAVPLEIPFKHIREMWLDHLERTYIHGLLQMHGRSLARIAEASGLDRSYVHRLMRKHEL